MSYSYTVEGLMVIKLLTLVVVSYAIAIGGMAQSGEADVVKVGIARVSSGTYTFHVTLRHADTGWEHYADKWDVVGPDDTILGTRVLLHPHVNEQPFTRSLSGVRIPSDITAVTIRAHDKVHGYGGREVSVAIPQAGG